MKKILLVAATASLIGINAYAGCETPVNCWNSAKNDWYLTVSAGAQWINNFKNTFADPDLASFTTKAKVKTNPGILVNAGAGWYVNEYFRTELVFTTVQNAHFKVNHEFANNGNNYKVEAKYKPKIYALMLKALFDLPLMEEFGLYAGPGIGVSWVQDNITGYWTNTTAGLSKAIAKPSNKFNADLAGGLFLGVNIPIDTFGQAFLETNYTYLGKSKFKDRKKLSSFKSKENNYQGFGVAVGMRIGF